MKPHPEPQKPHDNLDAPPVAVLSQTEPPRVPPKEVSPLWMVFIQVPISMFLHFASLVFVCLSFGTSSRTQLLLVASLHCLVSIAIGVGVRRIPSARGYGLGLFIGVALTALLTGQCALGALRT